MLRWIVEEKIILAKTDDIDKDISVERLPIIPSQTGCSYHSFRIVPIDVNGRDTDSLSYI